MKKMITIVAMMVISSVFAGQCGYTPEPVVKDTAWVYNWKFTGKTTRGVYLKGETGQSGQCGYVGGEHPAACVRTPASLKIQGYTYYCSPECAATDFETIGEEMFYMTKPTKSYLGGGVKFEVTNIIGKKGNLCEVAGKATFTEFLDTAGTDTTTYDITFSGIGKYDKKNNRIISINGNFAGTAKPIWYVSKSMCAEAGYWDCGCTSIKYDAPSVAFGKFSIKYDKSASKRYAEGKKVAVKYPTWVQKQVVAFANKH